MELEDLELNDSKVNCGHLIREERSWALGGGAVQH